jgi:two-component system sensor histidine kinase RegB
MAFPTFFKVLPQHETLRTIVLMRGIAVLCQILALALAQFWLGIDLRLAPLLAVIASLAAFNIWTWQRMRHLQPAGERELFAQLSVDVLALSALLYFSGGATNPFVSFYLPALAVAAALLPWHYALSLAGLAVIGYSLMMTFYVPLHMNDPDQAISYHLAGMWANFTVSATLITWFVARLSRTVRQRDTQLALAREQHLVNEGLIALGMQAANAAHEIGTPLSTVAIIAGELRREAGNDAALTPYREEFTTIEAQIALCKTALDRMEVHTADTAGIPPAVPITAWLAQFIDEWRLRYPATRIELSLTPSDVRINGALSLAQILTTLLDNAVQAVSSTDAAIQLTLHCDRRHAVIQVIDSGPGIAPDLLARLGYQQVVSNSNGRGIGLLLAFATARQIGATTSLTPHDLGGTRATLTIPVA